MHPAGCGIDVQWTTIEYFGETCPHLKTCIQINLITPIVCVNVDHLAATWQVTELPKLLNVKSPIGFIKNHSFIV